MKVPVTILYLALVFLQCTYNVRLHRKLRGRSYKYDLDVFIVFAYLRCRFNSILSRHQDIHKQDILSVSLLYLRHQVKGMIKNIVFYFAVSLRTILFHEPLHLIKYRNIVVTKRNFCHNPLYASLAPNIFPALIIAHFSQFDNKGGYCIDMYEFIFSPIWHRVSCCRCCRLQSS